VWLLLPLQWRLLLRLLVRLLFFLLTTRCRRSSAPQCLMQVFAQLRRGGGATDLICLTPGSYGQPVPLAAPLSTAALLLLLLLLLPP
jgi:hypothetical protein